MMQEAEFEVTSEMVNIIEGGTSKAQDDDTIQKLNLQQHQTVEIIWKSRGRIRTNGCQYHMFALPPDSISRESFDEHLHQRVQIR